MVKIIVFLVFLIAYALWAVGCFLITIKLQNDVLKGKSFLSGELMLLLTYAGFFGFIYLLSGLWSLRLLVLFLVAAHLGVLVAFLLNVALGAQSEKLGMHGLWAGKEIDIKFPRLSKAGQVLGGVIFFSYPVVAGILYFRHTWSSQALKILMVKSTLVLLILGGYTVFVTIIMSILASENLDEDTRHRYLINQFGGMIPNALFVALAIWAFGIGGPELPFDFAGARQTLSVRTLLLMFGFFAAFMLIPYVLGTLRAGRRKVTLLEKRRNYAAKVADILESPNGTLYVGKLNQLLDEISKTRAELINQDALLALADEIERNPDQISAEAKPLVNALEQTRDLDPRFKFLDDLSDLGKQVEETVSDLQRRVGTNTEEAAGKWGDKFEKRKAELCEEIKAARNHRPIVIALLATAVGLVASGFLGEVGKASWQIISHVAK